MLTISVAMMIGFGICLASIALLDSYKHAKNSKLRKQVFDKYINELTNEIKQHDLVNERLEKVKLLNVQQNESVSQLDAPSKNAIHARNKGNIAKSIISIEEEKLAIFKSILADGVNPTMSMYDVDGKIINLKMNELVSKMEDSIKIMHNSVLGYQKDDDVKKKVDGNKRTNLRIVKNDE